MKQKIPKKIHYCWFGENPISDDLYEKMKWIIENKRKSQEIAKSGQEYMVENMSSERNADEIYELYKRLLKH